jgi:pyruvate kinase
MAGAGKAKIVATLGPACREVETLAMMIAAGMDVARINTSHATHEVMREEVRALREVSSRSGREIGIILDLTGSKLRVGEISGGEAPLAEGQDFVLSAQPQMGNASRAGINRPEIVASLRPGDTVLLDDGAIDLRVTGVDDAEVRTEVVRGGVLRSHKGINVPGVRMDLQTLTGKDLDDLDLGLELGVDWIALSFVQSSRDVARLRQAIRERGADLPIVAKIEKREAVEDLDGVVKEADGVMVARGDLGVEMPLEEIPLLQKRIIEVAASHGKPVITATQMLQSMMEHPSPTRAEVSDVANAVFEGADAVMLSGETAVGRFPVQVVETTKRIVSSAESALPYASMLEERRRWIGKGKVEAICYAACELALEMGATAIVAPTESGFTAHQMSRFRPRQPILAPTPDMKTARRLSLYWGVLPRLVGVQGSIEEMFASAEDVARRDGYLQEGDTVVITAGVKHPGEEGIPTTNTIHCVTA